MIKFIFLLSSFFCFQHLFSQYNKLLAPCEVSFSTEFTFDEISKSSSSSHADIEIFERNIFGLPTRNFTFNENGDTSNIHVKEYNIKGLLINHYAILKNKDSVFYLRQKFDSLGNLLSKTENSTDFKYVYDSTFVDEFNYNTYTNNWNKISRVYKDSLGRILKVYRFGLNNRVFLEDEYEYMKNGYFKKFYYESDKIAKTFLYNKNNNLLQKINIKQNGIKDTVVDVFKENKKRLINDDEGSHLSSQFQSYTIDTFKNGLIKKVIFHNDVLNSSSVLEYNLNKSNQYDSRKVYEEIPVLKSKKYKFINIDTIKHRLSINRFYGFEEDEYQDENEELDNSDNIFNRKLNETKKNQLTYVYIIGKPEIITYKNYNIGTKKTEINQTYKSYISYIKYHYDTNQYLIQKRRIWGYGDDETLSYNSNGKVINKLVNSQRYSNSYSISTSYKYDNYNKLIVKIDSFMGSSDEMPHIYNFDYNGNRTQVHSEKMEYINTRKILHLGEGYAHQLDLNIPNENQWYVSLKGDSSLFALELLDSNYNVIKPIAIDDSIYKYYLLKGNYYLRIVNINKEEKGIYFLKIFTK